MEELVALEEEIDREIQALEIANYRLERNIFYLQQYRDELEIQQSAKHAESTPQSNAHSKEDELADEFQLPSKLDSILALAKATRTVEKRNQQPNKSNQTKSNKVEIGSQMQKTVQTKRTPAPDQTTNKSGKSLKQTTVVEAGKSSKPAELVNLNDHMKMTEYMENIGSQVHAMKGRRSPIYQLLSVLIASELSKPDWFQRCFIDRPHLPNAMCWTLKKRFSSNNLSSNQNDSEHEELRANVSSFINTISHILSTGKGNEKNAFAAWYCGRRLLQELRKLPVYSSTKTSSADNTD